jgi:hypothetical protein
VGIGTLIQDSHDLYRVLLQKTVGNGACVPATTVPQQAGQRTIADT